MVKQVLLNSLLPVCPEIHSPAFCCSVLSQSSFGSFKLHFAHTFANMLSARGGGRHGTWGRLRFREREEARYFFLSDWMVSLASLCGSSRYLRFKTPPAHCCHAFRSLRWLKVLGFSNTILSPQGRSFPLSPISSGPHFSYALSVTPKPSLVSFFLLNYLKYVLLSLLDLNYRYF